MGVLSSSGRDQTFPLPLAITCSLISNVQEDELTEQSEVRSTERGMVEPHTCFSIFQQVSFPMFPYTSSSPSRRVPLYWGPSAAPSGQGERTSPQCKLSFCLSEYTGEINKRTQAQLLSINQVDSYLKKKKWGVATDLSPWFRKAPGFV